MALCAADVNVLTGNYNNARTSANLNETVLNTTNVRPETFGRIGSLQVDGQVYAQPLYVSNISRVDAGR